MNNKLIIGVLVVLLGIYAIFLLSRNQEVPLDPVGNSTTTEETIIEEVVIEEAMPQAAVTEEADIVVVNVGGGEFYFNPEQITVMEGDTVRIVFTNEGGTHDWVIDEFNARTPIIKTGETAEVEFTADLAGSFEYYCSVGNHRASGMVGTLTVEPRQ